MTIFKTYLKVIRKNIATIILYTVILVSCAVIFTSTGETTTSFENIKPNVVIINNDEQSPITKNLVEYIKDNAEIVKIDGGEDAINDAIFYREISYIISIPENYGNDVLLGKNPEIQVKSTNSYQSALSELTLSHYLRIQNAYAADTDNIDDMIKNINKALDEKSTVEVMSKLDTDELSHTTTYFNFASYSINACIIFIVCLVLSSFNETNVRRRTIISCMPHKRYSMILFLSSGLYAVAVWAVYSIMGIFIIGDSMLTQRGAVYILNSFIFSISALSLAYLLSTVLHSKNAVTSIVNVIALGSSFLCGAFVSSEYLPKWVLDIAHIFPTYWYINTNDRLSTLETINFGTLSPMLLNMAILLVFSLLFFIFASFISQKKRDT